MNGIEQEVVMCVQCEREQKKMTSWSTIYFQKAGQFEKTAKTQRKCKTVSITMHDACGADELYKSSIIIASNVPAQDNETDQISDMELSEISDKLCRLCENVSRLERQYKVNK